MKIFIIYSSLSLLLVTASFALSAAAQTNGAVNPNTNGAVNPATSSSNASGVDETATQNLNNGRVVNPAKPNVMTRPGQTNPNATTRPGQNNPNAAGQPAAEQTPAQIPAPMRVQKPAPAAIPVNDGDKSTDQRDYENKMQARLDVIIKDIEFLETKGADLPAETKVHYQETLLTAAGNRSVARTKLKALKYVPPAQWMSLQTGIEEAFANVEASIARAKSYLPTP